MNTANNGMGTTIVKGVLIRGAVASSRELHIFGEVKGDARTSSDLLLRGVVEGDVTAVSARLEGGAVKGTLIAEQRIEMDSASIVVGDLRAAEIIIGGSVQGNILATGSVHLRAGSHVEGKIICESFSAEKNSWYDGIVKTTRKDEKASRITFPDIKG